MPTRGRHTFKAVGHRCGMSEKVIDAICGHAPASVGRAYGEPMLTDKAAELAKFPRYECDASLAASALLRLSRRLAVTPSREHEAGYKTLIEDSLTVGS
jgi:hypothetical protein